MKLPTSKNSCPLYRRAFLPTLLKVTLIAFLITACGEEKETAVPEIVRPVKMITIGSGQGAFSRSFPGRVRASQRVDLSFQVAGTLMELPVREGQQVKSGDLIARLDPRDFEVNLRNADGQLGKAQAMLQLAQSEYNRVLRIQEQDAGAVSQMMIDQKREAVNRAQAEIRSLEAAVDDAKNQLGYTRISAPFAGVIARRYVENYQEVNAKEPIVSLQDVTSVEILVDVPENVIATVRKSSLQVIAEFAAAPDEQFPLTLKEFATEADPQTQTYRIVLTMPAPEKFRAFPGMTATVRGKSLDETPGGSVIIPAVALSAGEKGKSTVWVVDTEKMTVSSREVTAGSLTGENDIEVPSGLKAGETIAVSGISRLREGMRVSRLEQ